MGVLKTFTLKKERERKRERAQNGKPEREGGDAKAANRMERSLDLGLRATLSLGPCHLLPEGQGDV